MKTILLVEPDRATADFIAEYMNTHKLKAGIAHASSAQEAVHLADTNKPNLVVLELAIPEHNGLAFLHEFRSYTDWKDVPIIIHSHISRDELQIPKDETERLGIVQHLYKPTTSLEKLRRVLIENLA
jgi:two-component system, OmpR family, KDP operon response regulator KdpE